LCKNLQNILKQGRLSLQHPGFRQSKERQKHFPAGTPELQKGSTS